MKKANTYLSRGLEVGDSKEKVKELYGLPDIGFYEDDEWIYLFYRDWLGDGSLNILSDDILRSYKRFIEKYPDSDYHQFIKEYYEILKTDGVKKTEKTVNLLEKYDLL
jgi:hypothetical protein